MVKSSMEKGNPSTIRKEVLAMLSNTNLNTDDLEKHLPKDISSLAVFSEDGSDIMVSALANKNGSPDGLDFMTGSGFGHWGIVVFPYGNGDTIAKELHGKTIPWKDGVYFWIVE